MEVNTKCDELVQVLNDMESLKSRIIAKMQSEKPGTSFITIINGWNARNMKLIEPDFKQFLLTFDANPFVCFLSLFLNDSFRESTLKHERLFCLVRMFARHMKPLNSDRYLSKCIQVLAFDTLFRNPFPFIPDVYDIFKLKSEAAVTWYFINYVIYEDEFPFDAKKTALVVAYLELHAYVPQKMILLPLIVRNQINVICKYLETDLEQMPMFLSLVESLIDKHPSTAEYIQSVIHQTVPRQSVSVKNLKALLHHFKQKFALGVKCIDDVTVVQKLNAMKFYNRMMFDSRSISPDAWKEIIQLLVGDDIEMQKQFLVDLNELQQYDVFDMFKFNSNVSFADTLEKLKIKTEVKHYFKLKLPIAKVKWIDNSMSLKNFMESLLGHDVIAIDCEWLPSNVNESKHSELSIIQIATEKVVYILDVKVLSETLNKREVVALGQSLFGNATKLVVGFAFQGDLVSIRRMFPEWNTDIENTHFLDMHCLYKQLHSTMPFIFSFPHKGGLSLNSLVCQCFGLNLDKSETLSNWNRRPLREAQIVYAALDAYCLLEIRSFLQARLEEIADFQNDFQSSALKYLNILNQFNSDDWNDPSLNGMLGESKPGVHFDIVKNRRKPISVNEISFVCDNMLQGLGHKLRQCGIDTVILKNEDAHSLAALIAKRENRIALTRGLSSLLTIKSQLPEGQCLEVIGDTTKLQCAYVLKYFNITVLTENIFSRCSLCNAPGFAIVDSAEIIRLLNFQRGNGLSTDTSDTDQIDVPSGTLKETGVPIVLTDLTSKTIADVDLYYVCRLCGKLYWRGSHWRYLRQRFNFALDLST